MRAGLTKMKVGIVTVLYLASCALVSGGESEALTLDGAVKLSLVKNPALCASDFEIAAREANIGQVRSGLLPQVDFFETYSRTNNPMLAVGSRLNQERFSTRDYALDRLNDPSPVGNFNSRLALVQPIFDQGKSLVSLRQAKILREEGEQGRERVKQEVIYGVIRSYTEVVVAQEEVALADLTLVKAEGHVKVAQDRFDAGRTVKSDLLSALVRLSEVRDMVVESRNRLVVSRAGLNRAIGIDQQEVCEVEGKLELQKGERPMLADVLSEAVEKRPDLAAMKKRIMSAELEVKKSRSDYLPSFVVSAQYDLNDEGVMWQASGESWTVMGMLRLNLFNGLSSVYRVKEASASLNRLSMEGEILRNGVEWEARDAFYRLQNAEERLDVAEEAVRHAEESMRIVEDRYQSGLSLMVEVLDNEVSLTRAKKNLLQSQYECRVAEAALDLARGVLSAEKWAQR
jgi:outer membrane protein